MKAAAGVLFVGFPRKVLMVRTSYKRHWDLPGGMIEPGETPSEAAERECKEELGVVVRIGRLLVCETVLLPDKELLVAWVFQGTPRDVDHFTVDGEEVLEAAWLGPGERIERTRTAPIFKRRLDMALEALVTDTTRYVEVTSR